MTFFLTFLLMWFPGQAKAESSPQTVTEEGTGPAHEAPPKVGEVRNGTRVRRENTKAFLLLTYSPIDLLIPGKYGVTLGMNGEGDRTWEFEYLRGSLSAPFVLKDLGSMTDQRFSLIGRSYFGGNSFNISYGPSFFDFSLHVGNDLLNRASATYPSANLVHLQAVGFNLAFGNRWSFKHDITFGIDWISWAQPVFITKKDSAFLNTATNDNDRDNVETAMKLISYFPRFALFKLQLGMMF